MINLAFILRPNFFGQVPVPLSMPTTGRLVKALDRLIYRKYRVVTGASVATHLFVEAVLKYSSASNIRIFTQPSSVESARTVLRSKLHEIGSSRKISVDSYTDLLKDQTRGSFNNWFDLALDLPAAGDLRSETAYPLFAISATHHTISYRRLLRDRILPILLTESLPCDSLICASNAARTALRRLMEHVVDEFRECHSVSLDYRGRFDTIPWGVDTELFRPASKERARAQAGLPREGLIILYVGRLSPIDKADLLPLLQVFSRIRDANRQYNPHLVIAGTQFGDYVSSILRYASNIGVAPFIKFIMSPQQTNLLYAAADIFVSPVDSIQESFGLTVLEALASGLPQVVPDWDGYRDLVTHGVTGFLVPTYWSGCDADLCMASPFFGDDETFDHVSLAQSVAVDLSAYEEYLTILIRNPELRATMAAQSRLSAVYNYDWAPIIARFDSLWEELGQIASQTPRRQQRGGGHLHPAYFECFSHYASLRLSDSTKLRLSPAGREALRHEPIHPSCVPASVWPLVDEDLLRAALEIMAGDGESAALATERESPADARTLGTVTERLRAAGPWIHVDFCKRHILWLLKYGLIDLDPDLPSS